MKHAVLLLVNTQDQCSILGGYRSLSSQEYQYLDPVELYAFLKNTPEWLIDSRSICGIDTLDGTNDYIKDFYDMSCVCHEWVGPKVIIDREFEYL